MDDIKLFAKVEKELEYLIQAVMIYSEDIRMEFTREICTMPIMKSGKGYMTEGMELQNKEKVERSEKWKQKYLEILEADIIKHAEKEEIKSTSAD